MNVVVALYTVAAFAFSCAVFWVVIDCVEEYLLRRVVNNAIHEMEMAEASEHVEDLKHADRGTMQRATRETRGSDAWNLIVNGIEKYDRKLADRVRRAYE